MPRFKAQSVKGMADILPSQADKWEYFKGIAFPLLSIFGFKHLETPILEEIKLFRRSVGQSTDIVSKEMFTLTTKGGDRLALRPEYTAGVVRAYIEHGMSSQPQPVKVFSLGPLFRYEQPQSGRFRQFHQLNLEAIGSSEAALDAEMIAITGQILSNLGIQKINVQVNSIGCAKCRPDYINLLIEHYRGKSRNICADCRRRMKSNPLRLLDCKNSKCSRLAVGAPSAVDHLCRDCHDHFKEVLEFLDELDAPYNLNPLLVRGLDYYTKTVFEFWPEDKNNFSLASGGRYDDLVELLGGKPTPAVGIALGIERILEMAELKLERESIDVFLAQLGGLAKKKALKLFLELQAQGFKVDSNLSKNSLKSQLKTANRVRAKYALILGQKEALEESIILRNMESGVQEVIALDKIVQALKKKLK